MAVSGTEVFRAHDEYGEVMVFDSAELRILSFDGHIEQSCVAKSRPWRLQYAYTQAMMLSLIFQNSPLSAAVLGLGGGSIARSLQYFYPQCQITAVELRESVVNIAKDWFFLEESPQLDIRIDRAENWLDSYPNKHTLIFTDLFHVAGMEGVQIERSYLSQCKTCLADNGILVINMWGSDNKEDEREARQTLNDVFGENTLMLPIMGGNRIVFGFANAIPYMERRKFMQIAEKLGAEQSIPLARFARLLWSANAMKEAGK